jgi:hypothetical protein
MDSMQRIYRLHQAISSRRHPVSCQTLQDELGCSRATVNINSRSDEPYPSFFGRGGTGVRGTGMASVIIRGDCCHAR